MPEFDDKLHERMLALCAEGDALATKERYADALNTYWRAIGDANFLAGEFAAGRDNLGMAMHCPAAVGNPFLHLRLGQCQFELGNMDPAADELTRAYMADGGEIFAD